MRKLITIGFAICFITSHVSAQNEQRKENSSLISNPINTNNMDTKSNEKQSFNEYKEVVKALEPYIVSARTGDGKLSRSAFYDHAHIVGSIDGQFYNMTADIFGGVVSEGGPSNDVQSHIAWIDISGPAAAAKVEFIDWNGLRFTDFFVLYKKDGQWKISGKVYDSHNKN